MSVPSIDIKDLLAADAGLALTFATNLFIGLEPAEPDDCVTIYDTPGRPTLAVVDPKASTDNNYYYPSVQIRVRNQSYETGWDLIHDIEVLLHGKAHFTANGFKYESILTFSPPSFLMWDENRRASFVTTLDLQRQPS